METVTMIINIILGIVFWYFIIKIINKKSDKFFSNIQLNNRWLKKIQSVSKLLIILLIFDEIGLLLNEWGRDFLIFTYTRYVISLPVISHSVYLANVFIASYTAMELYYIYIKDSNASEKVKKNKSFEVGLLVLSLSVIFFSLQTMVFNINNSNLDYSLLFIIFIIILFCLPAIILIYYIFNKSQKYAITDIRISDAAPIIMFLSLCQTMVTKVIVLFEAGVFIKNKIIKEDKDEIDTLFISSSLKSSSLLSRFNALFLTMYMFPMILLWVNQVSPLPSTSTVYPKGITVSLFFSLAIIIFPVIEVSARKYHSFIRLIFIPLLLLITYLPFTINSSEWVIGNLSGSLDSFISLMAKFLDSNITFILFQIIILHFIITIYLGITIYGEEVFQKIKSRNYFNFIMHSVTIFYLICIPTIVVMLLYPVLYNYPPYALRMLLPIFVILISIFMLLVYLANAHSFNSLLNAKEVKWKKYIPSIYIKISKKKILKYIFHLIIIFLISTPILLIFFNSYYNKTINTLYKNQPYNDTVYDSEINPLINSKGILYTAGNTLKEKSKVTAIDLNSDKLVWSLSYDKAISKLNNLDNELLLIEFKEGNEALLINQINKEEIYKSTLCDFSTSSVIFKDNNSKNYKIITSSKEIYSLPNTIENPKIVHSKNELYIRDGFFVYKIENGNLNMVFTIDIQTSLDDCIVSVKNNDLIVTTNNDISWYDLNSGYETNKLVLNKEVINNENTQINSNFYNLDNDFMLVLSEYNENNIHFNLIDFNNKKIILQGTTLKDDLFLHESEYFIISQNDKYISFYYDTLEEIIDIHIYNFKSGELYKTVPGTLKVGTNKDYQDILFIDENHILLYDPIQFSFYDIEEDEIVSQLWNGTPDKLTQSNKELEYDDIIELISHTIAVYTKPIVYENKLIFIDTGCKLHQIELSEVIE